ncbi:MAG: hypothetical protein NTU73_10750, partial [Ignavibacteriae bacterium]|nr:hypothetical protein [Ignavibacteriota bacterium]
MDFIKKYINWFLVLLIIILLIIIFKQIFPGRRDGTFHNVYIKDTNVLVRYENEIKRDTVIKWYENIIYKKSAPEKIFFQKIDTIFIEKTKDLDLMLQVKKEKKKLIIKAVNQNGKILKEYIYEDVNNDFTAVSQKENIFVKSKKFYWNKISPIFNVQWSMFNDKKPIFSFGLETGINYKEKIEMNSGILYSPTEKD